MQRALPAVLVPGRHPEPCRAGDARLDPRGRRARLCARHAFGAAFDNPDLARRLRRRRRRGGDRPARGELALRTSSSNPRDDGAVAADPAPERLQDREPDRARAHPGATSSRALRGLRLRPIFVGAADEPAPRASGAGSGAGRRARRDPRDPASGARHGARAPALADDRAAHAEGLDGPARGRRAARSKGHWRAHQVPLAGVRARTPTTAQLLEAWMRSYRPEELFDEHGRARARDAERSRRPASGA